MKRSFLYNISFNSLQLIINQSLGLWVFFVLSKQLTKGEFGKINWALAVFLAAFSICSFGIDQLIVRKIAREENVSSAVSIYTFHVLASGCIFYGSLLVFSFFFPYLLVSNKVLLFIGLGKLFIFFSTSFKQVSAGTEQFKLLLYMSIPSNIVKGILLTALFLFAQLNLQTTIIIFLVADFLELILCFFIFMLSMDTPLSFAFKRSEYLNLIRESLPQLGVNIFSSGIARFDWIFIGAFLSTVSLAEYSFAYRAFELSTLPLLTVAPILIPLFSRLQSEGKPLYKNKRLIFLLEMEMAVAFFTALVVNLGWIPLTHLLGLQKFGDVNRVIIFIFSLCMPVLYLNNFLWTICFAEGKLKMIFRLFAITFLLNILGNILLIPLYKNEGAALAYFFALLTQTSLYYKNSTIRLAVNWKKVFLYAASCALCGLTSKIVFQSQWVGLAVALIMYLGLLFLIIQSSHQRLLSNQTVVNLN